MPADALATAANIAGHESLYRLAFVAELLATAAYVVVTLLLYYLFEETERRTSLLAAFFSLVGCAAGAVSLAFHLAPLVALGDAPYLKAFSAEQLQALVLMLLRLRTLTYNIGLAFFGFYCLLIGRLAFKSAFVPRPVGVLMALSGVSWLTFLHPPLAASLSPANVGFGFLGEAVFTVWLLAARMKASDRPEAI